MIEDLLRSMDRACQEGRLADAEILCREALESEPRNSQALLVKAFLLANKGDLAQSIETLYKVVENSPGDLSANVQLAKLLRQTGRLDDAVSVCQQFLATSPQVALMQRVLGFCQMELGRYSQAAESLRKAADLEPRFFDTFLALGRSLRKDNDAEGALAAFERACELRPDHAEARSELGGALQEAGRFSDAVACLEQAIALDPRQVAPYLSIAESKKFKDTDRPLVEHMEELLSHGEMNDEGRKSLHYALGKAYDDLEEYEKAIFHIDEAARLRMAHPSPEDPPYDPKLDDSYCDFLIATYGASFFERHKGLGLPSSLPVFVIGSPRSGTTLVDQILSSHPQVGSAGEQPFWNQHAKEALDAVLSNQARAIEVATEYLDLLGRYSAGKLRVIDKMPTNYAAAGIIHALLPNARFIHCRRHPVDTCLSLYMKAGRMASVPFGHSRADLAHGYKNYVRVVQHFRGVLPRDRFTEVDYEEVVADKEAVARRLVAFCGLEWDDACLNPEKNTRTVNTPSQWQVRQPIYTTSVERWRKYEPWLGALRELLESAP